MSTAKHMAGDPRQAAFSFFAPPAPPAVPSQASAPTADTFDATQRARIAATLDEAARRPVAPMDRDQVAAAMSLILGRRVSKVQLDQWSAPSQADRRIHADALRALCLATSDWRAFHHFVEACGFKALTPQEAVCAEFGALHAVRRHLDAKAKSLAGDMEGLVDDLVGKMRREAI
ncbi:MAG: hypothetical protein AB7D00_06395 [Rhodospirillaceae bacterium]